MDKSTLFVLMAFLIWSVSCNKNSQGTSPPADTTESPVAAGCPSTDYDDWKSSKYVLPYPVGKSYKVTLSHCGGSYHSEGEPDQFAIDFDMPIGTPISASREGEVIFVEESGRDGEFPNNLIIIKHDDGTFAQYMHLTQNGALVEIGTEVVQGDLIGSSGNTGLAGFPHLHFVLTEPGSFKYPYKSKPTTFSNTAANERSLAAGTEYSAYEY